MLAVSAETFSSVLQAQKLATSPYPFGFQDFAMNSLSPGQNLSLSSDFAH